MSQSVARAMSDAAASVLATLDPGQLSVAQWPFPSEEERRLWFYTPTDHGGLTMHGLSPVQQRLVMRLIDSALSGPGYATVATVLGLENVLDRLEGFDLFWDWPRARDPLRYFLRIFGEPGSDRWGWRFGGHHVSLNFTVLNGEVISGTPCFLGADPASTPLLGGHLLRPLAACEDIARDLLTVLDDDQLALAVVSPVPPVDLVGANRAELTEGDSPLPLVRVWRNEFSGELREVVETIQATEEQRIGLASPHIDAVRWRDTPIGLPAVRMSIRQRDILRALIATYVDRVPEEMSAAEWDRVDASFDNIHFAWAGGLERGGPHYYRLHGPRLLAEYDNTTRQGNHVHTVWRDPVNDFGADVLGAHRRDAHGA